VGDVVPSAYRERYLEEGTPADKPGALVSVPYQRPDGTPALMSGRLTTVDKGYGDIDYPGRLHLPERGWNDEVAEYEWTAARIDGPDLAGDAPDWAVGDWALDPTGDPGVPRLTLTVLRNRELLITRREEGEAAASDGSRGGALAFVSGLFQRAIALVSREPAPEHGVPVLGFGRLGYIPIAKEGQWVDGPDLGRVGFRLAEPRQRAQLCGPLGGTLRPDGYGNVDAWGAEAYQSRPIHWTAHHTGPTKMKTELTATPSPGAAVSPAQPGPQGVALLIEVLPE
jgi:hypothetical protein